MRTFEGWLEERGASENTTRQYLSRVKPLESSEDPAETAVALLSSRGRFAPKSKAMMAAAFRAWGKYNGNQELLERIAEVKLPPAARTKVQAPLPPAAYAAIRAGIDTSDAITEPCRAVLGLMACRGLRRGDALRLKRTEVAAALKSGVLAHQAKGARRQEFGVTDNFRRYLELLADQGAWGQVHDLVSSTWRGAEQAVPIGLRRVAESVELGEVEVTDVRCHVLRRSYAVQFYQACGRDPNKLRAHMGWASIVTAMSYVDFVQRDELDAVAEGMF